MFFHPLLPAWLLVLLCVLVGVMLWRRYRALTLPACLRAVAMIIILFFLANPVRLQEEHIDQRPVLHIVCDASGSMAQSDVVQGDAAASGASGAGGVSADKKTQDPQQNQQKITRLQKAHAIAQELATLLEKDFTIEHSSMRTELTAGLLTNAGADARAAQGDTNYEALRSLAQPASGQAQLAPNIIVLGDGADRGRETVDHDLATAGVRVHTLALGSTQSAANVSISLSASTPGASSGQNVGLRIHLRSTAQYIGRQSELQLLRADGSIVFKENIVVDAEQTWNLTDNVGTQAGERLWTASLLPLRHEASELDNTASCRVAVSDKPTRVLVLAGRPSWDLTFAVRSWRRDSRMQVRTHYQLGKRRYSSSGSHSVNQKPLTLVQYMAEQDVIVIGQHAHTLLAEPELTALLAHVDQGGGVLIFNNGYGYTNDTLAALDPFVWPERPAVRRVTPQLTAQGQQSALLGALSARASAENSVQVLPTVSALAVQSLRPQTQILLQDDNGEPLLVERRRGSGRIISCALRGWWRWRLHAAAGNNAGNNANNANNNPIERMWRQMIRSITPQDDALISTDRPQYLRGETARLRFASAVQGEAEAPTGICHIIAPDGQRSEHNYQGGTLDHLLDQAGIWTLELEADAGSVSDKANSDKTNSAKANSNRKYIHSIIVRDDVREVVETAARPQRLIALSQRTQGYAHPIDQWRALATRLQRRAQLAQGVPVYIPLITSLWWFLSVLILLLSEWYLRRRHWGVL